MCESALDQDPPWSAKIESGRAGSKKESMDGRCLIRIGSYDGTLKLFILTPGTFVILKRFMGFSRLGRPKKKKFLSSTVLYKKEPQFRREKEEGCGVVNFIACGMILMCEEGRENHLYGGHK